MLITKSSSSESSPWVQTLSAPPSGWDWNSNSASRSHGWGYHKLSFPCVLFRQWGLHLKEGKKRKENEINPLDAAATASYL